MKKIAVKPEIIRTMTFEGQPPHAAECLFTEDGPEVVSIGFTRVPETPYYVHYKIISKGGAIVRVELDEQNIKRVVEETSKIAFVKEFVDKEH